MMDMYALLMGGSGGGGGSGLPSVTSADIGKSLIVGKKEELTAIFSEQTVEVSSGQAVLVGANTSLWTAGREVSIEIDGNITTGTLIDLGGVIGIMVGAAGAIALIDGSLVLYWDSDGDKTISIDAVSTSGEWEKDYAVLVVHEADGALNKTWLEVYTAILAGKMVVVATSYSGEEYAGASFSIIASASYDEEGTKKYVATAIDAYATGNNPQAGTVSASVYIADTANDYLRPDLI